jgi:regulator of protease activity HflC (stomatin/prohibitin superfamily)
MKSKIKSTILFSLLGLSVALTSCTSISPGSVGVKVNQWGSDKGVMEATECTGTILYNPFKYDIYEFPTTIQHKEYIEDESFVVNSKDGAEFHVSPIINYSVRPNMVVTVFKTYKKELSELEGGFIKVAVFDAFRIATNSFTSDSLISNRGKYESLVRKLLDNELIKNGFIISQFTSNLTYPETFKKAIEAKNAMVQQAQQAENQVRLSEANAKIQVAKAEGNAQSLIIQAKADAEANRLRQQSLTTLLVQQQFIEKWDGALPTYGTTPQLFKDITK